MSRRTTKLLKAALSTLHYTHADELLASVARGVGAIFMLHHVSPDEPGEFEPNRILKITPEFLEAAITQVRALGSDIVSLDEAHYRMAEGEFDHPFVCFTFDDGYKDNAEHAYPIFKRHNLPFAIYVATDFADGRGELWWLLLEKVIAGANSISLKINASMRTFNLDGADEKLAAFHEIYWWLRSIDETDARRVVRDLCREAGIDPEALCRELVMSWDEIRGLASDPLVTIGAHTRGHFALSKLSEADARAEMTASISRIEMELQRPCKHFSYPYGSEETAGRREFDCAREIGVKTAVTTRKGPLFAEHSAKMTELPRISLNGDYQDTKYLKVLLSGAPFVFWRMLKKLSGSKAA